MSSKTRMVPVLCCAGCRKRDVTLRKINGDFRMCQPCMDVLRRKGEVIRPDKKNKLVLKDNVISFEDIEVPALDGQVVDDCGKAYS